MFQDLLNKWISGLRSGVSIGKLSYREEQLLRNFAHWLETRSPTLRAVDTQATTEALIDEIIERATGYDWRSKLEEQAFRRFLRERLGRN